MSKLKWEGGKYHTWGPKATLYPQFFPHQKGSDQPEYKYIKQLAFIASIYRLN